ncbi:enoyl-CoA hydratase/isomerase family protein [Nocardioides sp. WS12]|uniref:enoyl-CoA hydratase/isomerase family protein n=1 Tax=Nocardioides sp. WS12 TaxID=2486272 RepID=UPI0015F9B3D8|nr:enoyl-CoA hydratase/isomerase family protein [Nocardioides sp. WS12]
MTTDAPSAPGEGTILGGTDQVSVTGDAHVRVITLNCPDKLNSIDQTMHHDLVAILAELEDDVDVRAVILTGAGDRAFSTGGRRGEWAASVDDRRRRMRRAGRLFEALVSLHVPVVAAVNGAAVGLGATLVAACDLVVMSENAFLADTHVLVGLVAGDGGAVVWPLHTGLLRAKEYLLTGDRLSASQALEIGLANRVVAPESVMSTSLEFANKMAALPPQAVQDTKMLLNQPLRAASVERLHLGLATETISFLAGTSDDNAPGSGKATS